MARWHSANVIQSTAGGRRLWHLAAAGDNFNVVDESTLLLNEPCPPEEVAKDWQTLFRKKLNVAWLPPDRVFFRVVQLPSSDPAEVASMVELQLEKVSPLPVTHIVWSMYMVPRRDDKPETMQTVVVIIAARSVVEEFLGQLSNEGFQPDRLEAPGLEQFLAARIHEDGVWIIAGPSGDPALVAWWYGGALQNLTLVTLPPGPERGLQLRTQLEQIAWAGELEGWLTGPLHIHLMTAAADAEFWQLAFKDWGERMEVLSPPAPKELASLSARRCAATGVNTSLLPPEFAARYQQQFVDRLWIRGLVSIVTLYILGVLFYFGMLYIYEVQSDHEKRSLATQKISYDAAQKDIAQIHILEDRQLLKYGALDCWKAVAESLPDTMTVERLYFSGDRLELNGTFSGDTAADVGTFNDALRTATDSDNHKPLFSDVTPPTTRRGPASGEWSFSCVIAKPTHIK